MQIISSEVTSLQTIPTSTIPKSIQVLNAWSIFFLTFGMLSIAFFHLDIYFPIWLSLGLMSLVVIYLIRQYKAQRVGLLMAVLVLVYLLPFIHIPPYLWYDFDSPDPLFGFGFLASNPYMFDEKIISLTAMLGSTGALGIAFSLSRSETRLIKDKGCNPDGSQRIFRSMGLSIWSIWIIFGICFSFISAPEQSIFKANYTESFAMNQNWNFSSAWMISYVILTFSFIDALFDSSSTRRRIKRYISILAIAYVIIWLQLLRGDRESMPWLFGLFLVYFYWADGFNKRINQIKINWIMIFIGTFLIVVISIIIGELRHSVDGATLAEAGSLVVNLFSSDALGFDMFLSGTWSAVLLSPLSVAGDHINGFLEMKWGQDYADILLSLPPGFVAKAIGYTRPLDELHGPAWDIRYGQGGTHGVVLPFLNFRMMGVFFVQALWAWFFLGYEAKTIRKVSVNGLSFLVSLVMASPHWLWYGEKAVINAILIWVILGWFYNISIGLK